MELMRPHLAVVFLTASLAFAQTPKEFDVASIKIAQPMNDFGKGLTSMSETPTSMSLRNYTLRDCVQWAYHVRAYQISGPGSITDERFDIVAKTAAPATDDQLRQMLQAELVRRFHLALHSETKELPVYLLIRAKTGPKLQPTKTAAASEPRAVDGAFVYDHISLPDFAARLSAMHDVQRPVIDRTGIKGLYDISIKFADSNKDLKLGMRDGDNPSVFRLVQEQVGLKLDPGKAPIEMLVIDRADKLPTGN